MHPVFRFAPIAAVVGLVLAAPAAAAPRTIFHNGTVFTSDPDALWAQAVAVEGNHILAVGTDDGVMLLATPESTIVDLGGRAVVPGLNDAHVHALAPDSFSINDPSFVPGTGPTLAEVEALLAQGVTTVPSGTWIMGFVGSAFIDDPGANRFALDPISPVHPVALIGWTGHGLWLNSMAMRSLGISETEPDPFGGRFERVPDSNVLTGVADEYAEFGVLRRFYALLSDDDIVALYQAFAAQAVMYGYTTLQDIPIGLTHARALSVLAAANLPLRVRSMCFPLTPDEPCDDPGLGPRSLVTATGIKWITDGTPIERLACVETPYADRPDQLGTCDIPTDALRNILRAHRDGPRASEQIVLHAVGDRAIDRILDALSDTGGPAAWHGRRTRIEHGDLLFPGDFGRVRALGAIIVQNPTHFTFPDVLAQRFQPAVFAELDPLRSLLDEDIPLAIGTDSFGFPLSPFLELYLATIHPTRPQESLTLEQALIAYTSGSAHAEFEEHRKGTLAPGMLADMAVLSQNIFQVPTEALPETFSVLTMVNGRVVWDAGVLQADP
jgi:hypothetical protein